MRTPRPLEGPDHVYACNQHLVSCGCFLGSAGVAVIAGLVLICLMSLAALASGAWEG